MITVISEIEARRPLKVAEVVKNRATNDPVFFTTRKFLDFDNTGIFAIIPGPNLVPHPSISPAFLRS